VYGEPGVTGIPGQLGRRGSMGKRGDVGDKGVKGEHGTKNQFDYFIPCQLTSNQFQFKVASLSDSKGKEATVVLMD
jgi:hypothetical protein